MVLNVITSVPPTTAKALIQGLKHDLLADDRELRALIPQELILRRCRTQYAERRREAGELQRLGLRRAGVCPLAARVRLLSETGGLYGQNHGQPAALWEVVNQIGGKERYFFGNILWQTRGALDLLVGHRLAKGALPIHG